MDGIAQMLAIKEAVQRRIGETVFAKENEEEREAAKDQFIWKSESERAEQSQRNKSPHLALSTHNATEKGKRVLFVHCTLPTQAIKPVKSEKRLSEKHVGCARSNWKLISSPFGE